MREGGRVSLPAMRRGLSPEGCRIRERHSQGSLTIGVQGVTVHPTERASRSQSSFLQENVRRLREIQAKCRDREQPSRRHQPLRATTRVSSASTTASTLSKTDGPADASLVKTGEGGAGRGDSAHSDYYSLSEDPPDPPPPTHPHYPPQGWGTNTSSRPQSPVLLRPLPTSPLPPPESDQHPLLPDAGLTREMRRLRMENLVSRISSQRPACEMDYHQHYRTIENQHRQLLDAVERINSSSGDAGSGEDSTRSRGGQARAATPPRMVRAYSFDRSTQARRREGSAERKSKAGAPGELKTLKKFHHRSSSPSPSSSFSSPQPVRSSRMISKSGRSLQDTGEGKGVSGRQVVGVKGNVMTESISKDELRGKRTLMRAKSELGRASPDIQPSGTRPPSRHGSLWSNAKQDAGDAASFSEDTNLNSTLSSSCDFYPGGHVDTESPRRATREDLKLAIRPDSQSTTAGGNHGAKDPNQNDWDSYNDLDFPQNSGADAENAAVHPDAVEDTQHSEPPGGQTDGTMGEKITGTEDRKIDDPGGLDETDDAHRAQAVATSTPVQNIGEDDGATAVVTTTTHSPRRLKREQQQPRRTRGDPLRRSQSLKNVAHTPGEPPPSYQIGKIPRYLQIRKEEKRRQEELALAVDPDCPPGHQPLPDHERLNTLHLLHKSQTQVLRELSSLPVAQDTLRIKKVRLTLEEKLTQIEEGLRIFSQPRVYIMNDD